MMNLRRIIFIVIALLAFLPDAEAQLTEYKKHYYGLERPAKRVELGVSVGGAYMMSGVEGVDVEPRLGFRAAIMMSMCWSESYAIQGEIAYLHNKFDASYSGVSHRISGNIVEVPILFSYRGLRRVRFNLGPVLNVASAARYDLPKERVEAGQLRSIVGYAAGVAVEITPHLIIDARYTGNFSKSDNYFEGNEFNMRSHWATLTIGYVF
jgi:hypothetical protein